MSGCIICIAFANFKKKIMKKILFGLIGVASLATLAFTAGDPLKIGSSMPKADVKMQDISGKEKHIEEDIQKSTTHPKLII